MNKKQARLRRSKKTRYRIKAVETTRLVVFKSLRHMYAQITTPDGDSTIVSASTLDPALRSKLKISGNIDAAKAVGSLIASRALEAGIKSVAFDRAGFAYHGRIKALADAAREAGLSF